MKPVSKLSARFLAIVILIAISAACNAAKPKNIILIIGDGMGIGAITAARCDGPGPDGSLTLDSMPFTGLVKTHSFDSVVTDSAASATAMATSHKTNNGMISVDPNGNKLNTILELAQTLGKSTGVITTDYVTGATPAAFYSHVKNRDEQQEIALQLANSSLTVAMGGGRQMFLPKSPVKAGRDDDKDVVRDATLNGFGVAFDSQEMLNSTSPRVLGLFDFSKSAPTLDSMLAVSLSKLSTNPKGFFIMAESCLPDKGGHANQISTSLKGVKDLEGALQCALKFAQKNRSTLVIVTGDHETGGLAVEYGDEQNPKFKPGWVYGDHSGNMVAVYAYGPGAEKFTGTHNNTDLPKIMAELWGKTIK